MPLLVDIPDACFENNSQLTTVNFPLAETMGLDAFSACPLLLTASFPSLTFMGAGAFSYDGYTTDGIQNIQLPVCTEFGISVDAAQFRNAGGLVVMYAPLLTAMGDPTDNTVFENITGNTMTITVAAALETIDAGNPDGDLVYLAANNTATINYV